MTNLVSEVTSNHFYYNLFVRSDSLSPRGGEFGSNFWREEYQRISGHILKAPQALWGQLWLLWETCSLLAMTGNCGTILLFSHTPASLGWASIPTSLAGFLLREQRQYLQSNFVLSWSLLAPPPSPGKAVWWAAALMSYPAFFFFFLLFHYRAILCSVFQDPACWNTNIFLSPQNLDLAGESPTFQLLFRYGIKTLFWDSKIRLFLFVLKERKGSTERRRYFG